MTGLLISRAVEYLTPLALKGSGSPWPGRTPVPTNRVCASGHGTKQDQGAGAQAPAESSAGHTEGFLGASF